MNLTIEIPEEVNKPVISLHDALCQIAEKRGITADNLYKIYYAAEQRNIFFNENDIVNKCKRREFATYYNDKILTTASCRFLYHSTDTEFTKIYVFNNDYKENIVIAKIIAEIYFQHYANEFTPADKCGFLVPEIYNYGFVENHGYEEYNVFYFTMENTNGITINNSDHIDKKHGCKHLKFIDLKYKAININKCLKCCGFFHNDLHSNNIMISKKSDDLFIIDYGESSKRENNTNGFVDFQYCIDYKNEKANYCL